MVILPCERSCERTFSGPVNPRPVDWTLGAQQNTNVSASAYKRESFIYVCKERRREYDAKEGRVPVS